jgi:hypothetical protein
MSVKLLTMVFDRYAEGGGERLLALALADHAHDDGSHISPTVAALCLKTGQSRSTVQRQLGRMLSTGWLQRAPGKAVAGGGSLYRICPVWIAAGEQAGA